MKRIVAAGICVILAIEVVTVFAVDRRWVLWGSGALVAVLVLTLRRQLTADAVQTADPPSNDHEESLQRWLIRTQTLIARSESTRADWDRHLRPILARQFEVATRQRRQADPRAFEAAGRFLFGDALWPWVDPDNVARDERAVDGPGRAVLDEILQRLERV